MTATDQFTYGRFIKTVLRVIVAFAILFGLLIVYMYYYFGEKEFKNTDWNFSFSIPVFLYLSFIMGWAIAYSKYFRFPNQQRVLLLGMGIAALIMPTVAGIGHIVVGQMEISELVTALPEWILGSLIGAAMQLYFMVIVLRYVIKVQLPF